jgi:hypothetical protein
MPARGAQVSGPDRDHARPPQQAQRGILADGTSDIRRHDTVEGHQGSRRKGCWTLPLLPGASRTCGHSSPLHAAGTAGHHSAISAAITLRNRYAGQHNGDHRKTTNSDRALLNGIAPGPGYDREASLKKIRENYEFLPGLLNQTLPRAPSDPVTSASLRRLRDDVWLDWHILLAIANVAFNLRANASGLLDRPQATRKEQEALVHSPETADSVPIPLAALSSDSLRKAMQIAVLAIAKRRWGLLSAMQTPNATALRALLMTRYGFSDDVPHRDLLSDALGKDGTLRQLIED